MDEEDDIAIVGVGGRFPGAQNIKEFWRVLVNGENHVNEIPKDRWNLDAVYDPNPNAYGKTYVRRAGLLTKHDEWDNTFFGIGEKEASEMDPQQRYVLECVHMALEDGGITRRELDGSSTGVYIGAMNSDYKNSKDGDSSLLTNYTVTGDAASIITARVSYNYNLFGPSLTIDTACSSALVAIHLAVQSIKIGESSLAICGGVNSILYPEMFVTLSKARMASPTGQCQAFSANADGYARGEGCGIVILEKVCDALKNDRHIWATIRTGCNQDGQTVKPITAPSQVQQYRLLQDVYIKHNIDPSQVQYLEAHGTGTPIGDPVEVNSLGSFFKDYPIRNSEKKGPRFIGSVKTNIGHLESAAGTAGLIKTLLMMKYGKIVPSLYSMPRNPKIPFETFALEVPVSVMDWPRLENGSRAACINCFGFGGTNAHAFVKQWLTVRNDEELKQPKESSNLATFVPISAKSQNALLKILQHLGGTLSDGHYNLSQVAYTASCRRDHYRYRQMLISSTIQGLIDSCYTASDRILKGNVIPSKDYRTVFVFCGVGTAWTQMGQDVIQDFPLFSECLNSIDKFLVPLTGWSIKQKIEQGATMDDPFTSHIGIFACQVGLATLWMHWGIKPDAIVGQSVGEVAAAYCCGTLTLKDAVTVIYYRSKSLEEVVGGKMTVVRNFITSEVDTICNLIGHVNVAVYNSLQSCTISGDSESVDKVKNELIKQSTKAVELPLLQDLPVKCAYHSYLVQNCVNDIEQNISQIKVNKPKIPIYSTVSGRQSDVEFGNVRYWKENVSQPVLFYQALQEATANNSTVFLEIGPKSVLKAHLIDIFGDGNVAALSSMGYKSGSSQIQNTLGELYTLGINPDWRKIIDKNEICDLPRYQFDCQRLMTESDYKYLRKQGYVDDSTGTYLMLTQKEKANEFKITLSPVSTPFVYEHVIDNAITVPGAIYAEVAFELGMCLLGTNAESMNVEFEIIQAISISEGIPSFLDLTSEIKQGENGSLEITFSVLKENRLVARGFVRSKIDRGQSSIFLNDLELESGNQIQCTEIYRQLEKHGYKYGEPVQILESITLAENEITGVLTLTDDIYRCVSSTSLHPAVLDAMLHSGILHFLSNNTSSYYKIYPIRMGSVEVMRPLEKRMVCYTKIIQNVYDKIIINILLTTPDGLVVAEVKEMEHRVIDENTSVNALAYQIIWNKDESLDTFTMSTDIENKHVCIIYGNHAKLHTLRNVFQHGKAFRLSEVAKDSSLIQSYAKCTYIETLIYAPGNHINNCTIESNKVFENVYTNCKAFLNLIKSMRDVVKTIIVITENTQSHLPSNEDHMNVLGAELWGFVRSVRHELTTCRVALIDVQPSIEREIMSLYKTVQAIISGDISPSLEFLIVDGHLFNKTLERRQQKGLQNEYKLLYMNCTLRLELRSSKAAVIDNPFLLPIKDLNEKEQYHPNFAVDQICLHSLKYFKVTELDSDCTKNLWSDYCKFGYPVIAIEFQGTEIYSRSTNREMKIKVACYPSTVSNHIFVPGQCLCDLDDLPVYKEGMFISSVLMWSLAQKVEQKSNVCILTESPESDLLVPLLLFKLNRFKQCNAQVHSLSELKQCRIPKPCTFVILEKYHPSNIGSIFKPGNTVIGFEDDIPYLSEQIVQLNARKINVHLVVKNLIFAPSNLVKIFPKIKHWLIHQLKHKSLHMQIKTSNALETFQLTDINSIKAYKEQIIQKNSTYIVVGGLSGLGWEIVKWLKNKGAGVVITLSRKGPSSYTEEKLKNIADIHDSSIESMRCDVGNYADVQETFALIQNKFPNNPIRGIFHGAGVLRDALVEHMTIDKFSDVLRPKVLGTWNLHLVSKRFPLDFFVMHSSTTSIFGNAGQTNYGAANAFIDSVAHYRRAHKLPGQSINWGALSVGMANDKAILDNLESLGYYALDTEKIKMCLMDSLIYNPTQILYGMFDWSIIKGSIEMQNTLEASKEQYKLNKKSQALHAQNTTFDKSSFREQTMEDQRAILTRIFFERLSKVLFLDVSEFEESQDLLGLGMESQNAMEFIQIIFEATSCRLPIAYVLHPKYTLGMLIEFVHSRIIKDFNSEESEGQESKEEVYSSPSWMEQLYIEMYNVSPQNPALWFYVDFRLGLGLSNVDMWKTILRWITIRNPELRTVYHPSNESIRFGKQKIVLDPEDAKIDFKIVDITVLKKEWMNVDVKKYCSFDITADPPMRVLYAIIGKEHYIRFIMSHITVDLSSLFTLIGELREDCLSYLSVNKTNIEAKEAIDIASLMEKELDAQYSLKNYWTNQLKRVSDIPTLANTKTSVTLSGENKKVVSHLPKEIAAKIISNDKGISVSKLLFSFYQILLHRATGKSVIPIVLCVDMRQHFPELIKRVSLGTNYIPVFTEFENNKASLQDFITLCSKEMVHATRNSLYPFLLIKQLENYNPDYYRHFFNVRDISLSFTSSSKTNDYWMHNIGFYTEFLTEVETALNVLYNHEFGEIDLVLTYDPEILSKSTAEHMLDDLCTLTYGSVQDNELRLDEIPLKCCSSDSDNDFDKFLSSARFMKETSKGWDHPVQITVDVQEERSVISWTCQKRHRKSAIKKVPVAFIVNVELEKMEGTWCLIIQTRKRCYYFKNDDFFAVRTWKDRIRNLISKT